MIIPSFPAVARCDGCGAEGEVQEARNARTGTLTAAFLPRDWTYDRVADGAGGHDDVHRCGACTASAADPFGDRRDAFEARIEHLGPGLITDISISLGVPIGIGRRWAAEYENRQRRAVA